MNFNDLPLHDRLVKTISINWPGKSAEIFLDCFLMTTPDELGQYQKTKYYIGSFYLQVIGTVLPMFILGLSYTITLVTFASFIVTIAVFHAGAIKVFQACASFKKASALDTLVVLGLPVCVKIHIGYWAAYVLIASLLNSMNGPMLL